MTDTQTPRMDKELRDHILITEYGLSPYTVDIIAGNIICDTPATYMALVDIALKETFGINPPNRQLSEFNTTKSLWEVINNGLTMEYPKGYSGPRIHVGYTIKEDGKWVYYKEPVKGSKLVFPKNTPYVMKRSARVYNPPQQ